MGSELTVGETSVRRIGLGTNRLTNTPDNQAFLRGAIDAGINFIDTAYLYTRGDSERTIGAALAPFSKEYIVATKGGYEPGEGRPEILKAQIEESLRRLRVDVIELYYLHRVHPGTPLETSLLAIREYRDRGTIRHIGISEVGIEEIERAREIVPITRRSEPLQPLRAQARGGDRLLRPGTDRVRAVLSTARRRETGADGDRRGTPSNSEPGHARVAAQALADDAADPWNALARACTGEPRRARRRADRGGVPGTRIDKRALDRQWVARQDALTHGDGRFSP